MIRTLHIVTALQRRGAETFAVQLTDRLDRTQFSPHIWPTRPAHSEDALTPAHTQVVSNGANSLPQALLELHRVLRTVRPHLIQCHGGRSLKYAMTIKPFWRSRVWVYNKILSVHPHFDRTLRRLPYKFLFEQVDAIVAETDELCREIKEVFCPRGPRIVSIKNGRDVRPFVDMNPEIIAEKRCELGLGVRNVCLMQIGIAWEKDPQVSLNVFTELAPRFPELRLVFVGEGPLREALRDDAAKRGLAERVRVLGVRNDVPALLAAADVVLLPSITEGMPGVLIEAGMSGRPAVAYDVGSVREVLIDSVTGFVVSRGDVDALAAKVVKLVQDHDLRERMGREALTRCRRNFDIEATVREYEALFAELVETRTADVSILRKQGMM